MLDYPMAVATRHDLATVRDELADVVRDVVASFAVPEAVLSASARALTSPVSAQVHADLLGRPATCGVTFWVDNKATDDDGYLAAYPAVAVAAVRLGEALDAETCLTFQLDRVVMRRRAGRIEVHDWFPWWAEPAVAAALPADHVSTGDPGRL